MYLWKYENLCVRNQTKAGKLLGVTPQWISTICARKVKIRKLMAYSITKYIDKNAEIEDYFERIG